MKRILPTLLLLAASLTAQAAYLKNVPVVLLQPNGDTLRCLATLADLCYMPPAEYTVALTVNDPSMGTATGAGTYHEGDTATLLATPFEGYRFARWSDGLEDSLRTLVVTRDTAFTAHFEARPPDTVWHTLAVEVLSHPEHGGWGSVDGAGTYPEGTVVTLSAWPGPGCALWYWDDGTCDEERQVTLLSDTTLTATFGPMCIGIHPAEPLSVSLQGRQLTLRGTEARPVSVSDLLGRLHFRAAAYDGQPILLPHAGVYLLRVEGLKTQKIIVK